MTYHGDPEDIDHDGAPERRCICCGAWTSHVCDGCDQPVCLEDDQAHFERVHDEEAA